MKHQNFNSATLSNDSSLFLVFTNYIVLVKNAFRILKISPFDQSHFPLIYNKHLIQLLAFFSNDLLVTVYSLFEPRSQLLYCLNWVIVEIGDILNQIWRKLTNCNISKFSIQWAKINIKTKNYRLSNISSSIEAEDNAIWFRSFALLICSLRICLFYLCKLLVLEYNIRS